MRITLCDSGRIPDMKTARAQRRTNPFRLLSAGFGVFFLLFSLVILVSELQKQQAERQVLPAGSAIQGVPVGNLSREQAQARLAEAFSVPLELRYNGARMQFLPADLGFSPDLAATLNQLDAQLPANNWWNALWNQPAAAAPNLPLQANLDKAALQTFLQTEVAARYDQPATAALPILYSTNFSPGSPGLALDLAKAQDVIRAALFSPTQRIVDLPVSPSPALGLDPRNLEIFLKQTIQLEGFDGLVEIYLHDLSQDSIQHFAVRNFTPVPPDVAYSAASTIKIPIMASVFNHLDEPTPELALGWMERMIAYSDNPPADSLMKTYLDETYGPLTVTADMESLGYANTFLAGYFYAGAPLLQRFTTPANARTDVNLDPDFYNQTVPSEIGDLLTRTYTCAKNSPSQPADTMFSTSITAAECQTMLDLLAKNQIGLLIEAGLPPEGSAAHKHGWTSDLDGLLHTMSDAGIVFTPGGDYVLIIFINSSDQLIFSEGNWLFARLSQTIYNAFNLDKQAAWLAD